MVFAILLSPLKDKIFDRPDLIQSDPRTKQDVINTAKLIMKKIKQNTANVSEALFDPYSQDFNPLKEQVEKCLIINKASISVGILGASGLVEDVLIAYRKSKELEAINYNDSASFYNLLKESLHEFANQELSAKGLLTNDDIPTILKIEEAPTPEPPTIEDLKKTANNLFEKSSQKQYVVDTENINWHNLVPPETALINFPNGNSRIIDITFVYKNHLGENLTLNLNFDTRTKKMRWLFLEDPEDSSIQGLKNSLMHASHSVISKTLYEKTLEYEQKQKTTHHSETQNHILSRPKQKYTPAEKQEKQNQSPKTLTPIQQILQSNTRFKEPPRIKNQIKLPEEDELIKMMRRISHPDQQLIIQGIKNYNEKEIGEFIMLTNATTDEGKKLYRLRINAGPRGGSRVLLEEVKSDDTPQSTRTFKITDIDYRKNIYRKI